VTDFLYRLAARTLDPQAGIAPRVRSRFEPTGAAGVLTVVEEELEAPAAAPVATQTSQAAARPAEPVAAPRPARERAAHAEPPALAPRAAPARPAPSAVTPEPTPLAEDRPEPEPTPASVRAGGARRTETVRIAQRRPPDAHDAREPAGAAPPQAAETPSVRATRPATAPVVVAAQTRVVRAAAAPFVAARAPQVFPVEPAAAPVASPPVQVSIGRIEVRAVPQAAPAPARAVAPPIPSLEDYLASRADGAGG
jgi:hypothetical protein